jgi:hypothetical protein
MSKQPKVFTIVSVAGDSYYRPATDDFAPMPPPPDGDIQIDLPDDAWQGYYAETRTRLRQVQVACPAAEMSEVDVQSE